MNQNLRKGTRIITRVIISIIITLVLLVITTAIILYNSREKIKSIVVTELNQSLKSEISVQDIDFSFFKTFPYASLQFKKVLAKEVYNPYKPKDTLFYADVIALKFNIIDIYKKNYQVTYMDIKGAGFYMKYFKDSIPNYVFWKTDTLQSKTDFEFRLKKVQFYNTRYIFHNEITRQHYDFLIEQGTAKGDFSSQDQAIQLKGAILVNFFQTGELMLFNNLPAVVDVDILHKVTEKKLIINRGSLELQKLPFLVNGNYCYSKDNSTIDINIQSKKISLGKLIQFLPENTRKLFATYKSTGILDIVVNISEQVNLSNLPLITATFSIQNGSLSEKNLPVSFKNINVSGVFKNGKKRSIETYQLLLQNISTNVNNGIIKGNLYVENFKDPNINASLNAVLNFTDIHNFLKNESVENIEGNLKLDIQLKGTAKGMRDVTSYALNQVNISGLAEIDKTNIKLKQYDKEIKNLETKLFFNNKIATLQNTSLQIGSSVVKLDGELSNILPFIILPEETLIASANIFVDQIALEEFLPQRNPHNSSSSIPLYLPKNINAIAVINVKHFQYKAIEAKNLKVDVDIKPSNLFLKNMKFNSLKGSIDGDLLFSDITNGDIRIVGKANLKAIDITQLFSTFNNFGQTTVTKDNLQGSISANTNFSILYNPITGIDKKNLKVFADTKIENGALLNFKPLLKLSRFVEDEALNNVYFNTLTNIFQVKDEIFEIPKMEVKSNALNFEVSGIHKFNNEINYRLKMRFSELSSKKQKARLLREQKEFGNFEEDNTGKLTIYLLITGTMDNPVFKYDSKSAQTQIKENIRIEKENLKNILKNEFSGSEATQKEKENWKKQEDGNFLIDWDESKSEQEKKKTESKKETKFNIDWE